MRVDISILQVMKLRKETNFPIRSHSYLITEWDSNSRTLKSILNRDAVSQVLCGPEVSIMSLPLVDVLFEGTTVYVFFKTCTQHSSLHMVDANSIEEWIDT